MDTHRKTPVLESLFNKVGGLQDCCKTYLLHALLRFYFSLYNGMASSIIRFFKLASVKSVKTVCVCIVFFFHYFKYYGQNIFSRIMELYLTAKVERTNFLFKTWNYLVSERRGKMFQVNKAISKDVRKQLFHHSCFFLICQVCRPLCKENVNIIQFSPLNQSNNK